MVGHTRHLCQSCHCLWRSKFPCFQVPLFSINLSLNIDIAQPIILLLLWVTFKLYNRRWWVRLGEFTHLAVRLNSLKWKKRDENVPDPERDPATFSPAERIRQLSHPSQPSQVDEA
jgi:hypothetical protein